jgi:hypothetical protein
MRNDAAAELSFAHVLSLDTENVIALKALAEIAERGSRFSDAERWLEQLLAVDRSNDEAEAQLERVRAAKAQASVATEGSAVPGALDVDLDEVPEVEGLETDVATPAAVDEAPPVPPLSTVERATEDARLEDELPPEPAPFRVDSDAAVLDDAILGVTQLGGGDEIVLEAAPSTEYQLPSASEDFGKGPLLEDGAQASEFQLPSASEDLATLTPAPVSEFQLPSASDDLVLPDAGAMSAASEYQLPDASSDLSTVSLTGTEGNEFQAADAARELVMGSLEPLSTAAASDASRTVEAVQSGASDGHSGVAAGQEVEEAPGQWVTWADAALDPHAEPFEEHEGPPPFEEDALPAWSVPAPAAPLEATVVTFREEEISILAAPMAAPEDATEAEALPEPLEDMPELVVTESMAELFLSQGHPADALRVYRQLLSHRPDDTRLIERIAMLEVAAASAAPASRVAASVSGGTSVREMMRSLLTSRPNGADRVTAPAAAAVDTPGAPTRPAPDHLTLSAIFGDDASPLPPVMRPPPARPAQDRGVTFDEFYGGAPSGIPAQRERTTRVAQGEDDLDQFHDWLQNLKR